MIFILFFATPVSSTVSELTTLIQMKGINTITPFTSISYKVRGRMLFIVYRNDPVCLSTQLFTLLGYYYDYIDLLKCLDKAFRFDINIHHMEWMCSIRNLSDLIVQ